MYNNLLRALKTLCLIVVSLLAGLISQAQKKYFRYSVESDILQFADTASGAYPEFSEIRFRYVKVVLGGSEHYSLVANAIATNGDTLNPNRNIPLRRRGSPVQYLEQYPFDSIKITLTRQMISDYHVDIASLQYVLVPFQERHPTKQIACVSYCFDTIRGGGHCREFTAAAEPNQHPLAFTAFRLNPSPPF
ncbi:MAG: hypothetical protein V4725_19080 [Bacteroidota bacterium]